MTDQFELPPGFVAVDQNEAQGWTTPPADAPQPPKRPAQAELNALGATPAPDAGHALPDGFVAVHPDEAKNWAAPPASAPIPPQRPADLAAVDPNAGYDRATTPPARPTPADLSIAGAQANDAANADLKSKLATGEVVQFGDKYYQPGNPTPIGSVPQRSADQAIAAKTQTIDAAQKKLDALKAAPLSQFDTWDTGPGAADLTTQQLYGSTDPKAKQAAAIKAAQAELDAAKGAEIPTLGNDTSLVNTAKRAAGKSVLDMAKYPAQVLADAGIAQKPLDAIDNAGRKVDANNPVNQIDANSFGHKLAGGLGGVSPYLVGGMAGLGLKTFAAMGGLSSASQLYDEAADHDAPMLARHAAALGGGIVGASMMALPMTRFFDRALGEGSANYFANMARQALQGGVEFSAFSGAATIANNTLAKGLFDKDRDLMQGVKESAESAFWVGSTLGLFAGLGGKRPEAGSKYDPNTAQGRANIHDAAEDFDWVGDKGPRPGASREESAHAHAVRTAFAADTLGVKPDATPEEVRAAWVAKSKAAHPDNGGSAEDQQRVNAAYAIFKSIHGKAKPEGSTPSDTSSTSQPGPASPSSQPTPSASSTSEPGAPRQIADPYAGKPIGEQPVSKEDDALLRQHFDADVVDGMDAGDRAQALALIKKSPAPSTPTPTQPQQGEPWTSSNPPPSSSDSSSASPSLSDSPTPSAPNSAVISPSQPSRPTSSTEPNAPPAEIATNTTASNSAKATDPRWAESYRQQKELYGDKLAPVQGLDGGIPWVTHLRAYDGYVKEHSPQPGLTDLRTMRGGFGPRELDQYAPGWRDEVAAHAALARAENKAADAAPALDTGHNQPESQETLHAQIAQLTDPDHPRSVVMFPRGTTPPEAERPPGIGMVSNERGTFWYDPDRIDSDEIKAKSAQGRENEFLGLGDHAKPEIDARVEAGEKPVVVTERDKDGNEIRAAYGTEQTAPAQIEAMKADAAPGSTIAAEKPEATIAGRKKNPAKERPPQSLVAFIRMLGGVKDYRGELRNLISRFPGLVNNKRGMELDKAREAAAEAGYFGHDVAHAVGNTTVPDFLNALAAHPLYSAHDADRVSAASHDRERAAAYEKAVDDARHEIAQTTDLDANELDPKTLHAAALLYVEHDVPIEDAFERAAIQSVESQPLKIRKEVYESAGIPWDEDASREPRGPHPWDVEAQEPPAGATAGGGQAADGAGAKGKPRGEKGPADGGRPQPSSAGENAPAQEGGRPGEEIDEFDAAQKQHDAAKKLVTDAIASKSPKLVLEKGKDKLVLSSGFENSPYRITSWDKDGPSGHRDYGGSETDIRWMTQEIQGALRQGFTVRAPANSPEKPESSKPFATEAGADGKPQTIIPGAEKIGDGAHAQNLTDKPLKPKKQQKTDVGGMFDDANTAPQLFDAPQAKKPTPAQIEEMFKQLPRDIDAWDDLRVSLVEKHPDMAGEILDAMGRADPPKRKTGNEMTPEQEAARLADADSKVKAIRKYLDQGGKRSVSLPSNERVLVLEQGQHIKLSGSSVYVYQGSKKEPWVAITADQLNSLAGQAGWKPESDRTSPEDMKAEGQRIADEARDLAFGPADAFAKGVEGRLTSEKLPVTESDVKFWREKLESLKAQSGEQGKNPEEQRGIKVFLDPAERRMLDIYKTRTDGLSKAVIARAEKAVDALTKFINERGFKVHDVNSSSAKDAGKPEVLEAKGKAAAIAGATSRLLRADRKWLNNPNDAAAKKRGDDTRVDLAKMLDAAEAFMTPAESETQAGGKAPSTKTGDERPAPVASSPEIARLTKELEQAQAALDSIDRRIERLKAQTDKTADEVKEIKDAPKLRPIFAADVSRAQAALAAARKSAPPAESPKDTVLRRGRASGNENAVFVDQDGKVAHDLDGGTKSFIGFTKELQADLADPTKHLIGHHNHPGSMSLSPSDIVQLGAPGLRAVHAHGHDGATHSAQLTTAMRATLEGLRPVDMGAIVALSTRLAQAKAEPIIAAYQKANNLTVDVTWPQELDAINRILQAANVIDYETSAAAARLAPLEYASVRAQILAAGAEIRSKINDVLAKAAKSAKPGDALGRQRILAERAAAAVGQKGAASIPGGSGEVPGGVAAGEHPGASGRDAGAVDNSLSGAIANHFLAGESFPTILEARKFVKAHPDGGKLTVKQMDEAIEVGVVRAARELIADAEDPQAAYSALVDLYGRQPNLSARTSQSVAEQAYSTPAPLAYLASQLAGIGPASHVYEPTAGNGMLLIGADPKHVVANELNNERNAALGAQGIAAMAFDASNINAARHAVIANDKKPFDVVIANPPFGSVKDGGASKVFTISHADGWKTTQIDHAIALEALWALKPGGRAVLIIGGVKAEDPAELSKGYRGKAKREFFHHLQKAYNVVDHFTVSGDLYTRQGAGWPVDVIVIDGQGPSDRKPPSANPPQLFKSWEDLKGKLDERPGTSSAATAARPGGEKAGGAIEGVAGAQGGHGGGGGDVHGGGAADGAADPAAPVPVLGKPDSGKSGGVRPERPVDDGAQHPAGGSGKPDGAGGNADPARDGQLADIRRKLPEGYAASIDEFGHYRVDGPNGFGVSSSNADSVIKEARKDAKKAGSTLKPAAPSSDPFDSAFDAGQDAADNLSRPAAPPRSGGGTPPTSRPENAPRGPSAPASSSDALANLANLFNAKGRGLSEETDPTTWSHVKPLFAKAAERFPDVLHDVGALVRQMVVELRQTHGLTREGMEAMKPYLRRFVDELQSGALKIGQDLKNEPDEPRGPYNPPALTAAEEGKGQVAYHPASEKGVKLDTLVPANLRDAAIDSLRRIEAKHGDVDTYVADALGYKRGELGQYFSAEQIDAIALAINNVEKGAGFIIGDQTGIGKGRVVAAAIAYAHSKSMAPVFVTEKPDLYGDMWRDLHDIGFDKKLGRPIQMFMTNTGTRVPLDEEAIDWVAEKEAAQEAGTAIPPQRGQFSTSQSSDKAGERMGQILSRELRPDVVFTTYDQMNSVKGQETPRRHFLRAIAPHAFLIMDEAHNAGGSGATDDNGMVGKAPPRSHVFRQAIAAARAVMYSSATYAKNPKVMDLYARTDMAKAVEKPSELPALIAKGGVPLQQVVSTALSRAGQYMRRERSFDGVSYDMETAPVNQEAYAQFTDGLGAIFTFDRTFSDERGEIAAEMASELGAGTSQDGGVGEGGASTTEFSSIMHNAIGQMILSIKAKAAAERAIQSLRDGERPVIALSSTMGAFINDFVDSAGLNLGDKADLDFGAVLRRYLERTRRFTLKMADGEKRHVMIPVAKMSPDMQTMYRDAETALKEMDFSDLPISPIDYIRSEIEKAGFSVREITGRSTTIDYSGAHPVLSQRPANEMGPTGKAMTKNRFNSGTTDALIVNRSGSTGISLHASSKFKDQRRRRMIILQADPNIDTFMQMLGRIHRTGQVIAPAYSHLVANIPAEARPAAVLMRKMASLNANTTGARSSKFSGEAVDFMNQYGDAVVASVMGEDPELNWRMGGPVSYDEKGRPFVKGAAAKVTGRLTLLKPDEQQELLDKVTSTYQRLIAQLDAIGENKLEAKTLDLQAESLGSTTIRPRRGDSPFEDEVRLEQMSVKSQGRAMSPDEAIHDLAAGTDNAVVATGVPLATAHRHLIQAGSKQTDARAASVIQAAHSYAKERLAGVKADDKDQIKAALDDTLANWRGYNDMLRPGALMNIEAFGGELPAMVLSVQRISKSKNPAALSSWSVRFAIPDAARTLEIPFSRLGDGAENDEGEKTSTKVEHADYNFRLQDFFDLLDNARKDGRERREIFTGNMLAAFDAADGKGQIVNFTMADGSIQPGIMTPRGFNKTKFMAARAVKFANGAQALKFLAAKPDGEIASKDNAITVRRQERGGGYEFDLPAAKATGGRYYADKSVRAVYDGWEKRGSRMRATVGEDKARRLIDAMMGIDAVFETREHQDIAQGIVDADKPAGFSEEAAPVQAAEAPRGWGYADAVPAVKRPTIGEVAETLGEVMERTLPASVEGLVKHQINPVGNNGYGDTVDPATRPHGLFSADEMGDLVTVSMESTNPRNTAYHESWHAVQKLGLATPAEIKILRSPAETARLRKYAATVYGEETAADMSHIELEGNYAGFYCDAKDNGRDMPPPLHAKSMGVFERFWNLLRNIRDALRRKFGFKVNADDVFEAFRQGKMKDRPEGKSRFWEDDVYRKAMEDAGFSEEANAAQVPPRDPNKIYDTRGEPAKDGLFQNFRADWIDLNHPTKQLGDRLADAIGRPLRDDENAYLAKRLLPGKLVAQHEHVKREFEDKIVKAAREGKISLGEAGRRLLADHAEERNAAIDALHDWRKAYVELKRKARDADDAARAAEDAVIVANQTVTDREADADLAKKLAMGAAGNEVGALDPSKAGRTDAAFDRYEKAMDAVRAAKAVRAGEVAVAKRLRAKAQRALAIARTPMDKALAAMERARRASDAYDDAVAASIDKADWATEAADNAGHIKQIADHEAAMANADPTDARQQTRAANRMKDAITARVRAKKAKEAALAAKGEKDRAATRRTEAAAAAAKKMDWATAEEARRDEKFDRIKGHGSGITNAEAQAIRAKQRADGKEPALDKIAQLVRQMMNYKQHIQVDSGLVEPDLIAQWNRKYPHYADLRGFEDPDLEPSDPHFPSNAGKMEARGPESKQAFGRASISGNPLVNMVESVHRAIERAEVNKAAQSLYRAVESALDGNGDALAGLLKLDRGDSHQEVDKLTGLAKTVQDGRYVMDPRALMAKFDGKARYVVFDDAKLAADVKRLSPDAVGELGRYVLLYQNTAKFMWTHAAPAFMVRHFAGRYPMEGALNAGAGGYGAFFRAWKSYPFLGVYHQAVRTAGRMDVSQRHALAQKVANGTATKFEQYQAYYHETEAEGGLMGRNFFDMEQIANTLEQQMLSFGDVMDAKGFEKVRMFGANVPLPAKITTAARVAWAKEKAFFAWMDRVTGNMDAAQRTAAHIEGRMKRGLSKPQAALEAREATVDFHKAGRLATKASLAKTFFKVAVNTGDRLWSRRKQLKYVIGHVVVAGFVGTLLNFLFGGQDDDGIPYYEKIASWERQSNIVALNPYASDRKGRPGTIKWPLPYNYALPYNIGAALAQSMLRHAGVAKKESHGEIAGRAFRSAVEALTPLGSDESWAMFAPTVVEPFVHVGTNTAFTGAPLHNDSEFAAVAASEQGKHNTPEHWIWLAKTLNAFGGGNRYQESKLDAYPESLREILGFVTEAQERTASQMMDAVHAVQNKHQPDWGRVPGVNVFVGSSGQFDKADQAEFYETRGEAREAARTVHKADQEHHGDQVSDEQRRLAAINQGFTKFDSTSKKEPGVLRQINERQQRVREDQTMTGAQKSAELERLEQIKTDKMHQFMKAVRDYRK